MSDLTLYGSAVAPAVWSIKMALEEKEESYAFYDYQDGSDLLKEEHSLGRSPVVRDADIVLFETAGCLVYIDDEFGSPPLQPRDSIEKAEMIQWMSFHAAHMVPLIEERIVYPRVLARFTGQIADASGAPEALEQAKPYLEILNKEMRGRRWIVGAEMSLADVMLAPLFFFFKLSPEGQQVMGQYEHIAAWYANMTTVESFRDTKPSMPGKD